VRAVAADGAPVNLRLADGAEVVLEVATSDLPFGYYGGFEHTDGDYGGRYD